MKPGLANSRPMLSPKAGCLALMLAFISFIFLSPKWLVPAAAWSGPAAMLLYYRYASFKRKYLWLIGCTFLASVIGFYEVVPIPGFGLLVFVLLNGLLNSLPYVIDKAFSQKHRGFLQTLAFPVSCVAAEFIGSNGPWGAWNSPANSQFGFPWLIQIASVTGLWGISFLFYWFAATVAWLTELKLQKRPFPATALIFPVTFVIVLTFGAFRYNYAYDKSQRSNHVKAAGITVSTIPFLEALHADVYQQPLKLSPDLSPISPALQKANTALIPFIEHPDSARFRKTLMVLRNIQDSLFILSRKAAQNGAALVEWSEGSIIIWKQQEPQLLDKARNFAKANHIDMVIAVASIETGTLTPGRQFMENKAIYIDKNGRILNTLFKNKPVPGIEPTKPGDGNIPAIKTDFGTVSTSICYDADFPGHMRQLGKQASGLLLLPSGDWKAIDPYHSNAAILRAVENGCSILRQVSGGLSVAADYRGKMLASRDYFTAGEKMFIADIPVEHHDTIYTTIGDSFAYLCTMATLGWLLVALIGTIARSLRNAKLSRTPVKMMA